MVADQLNHHNRLKYDERLVPGFEAEQLRLILQEHWDADAFMMVGHEPGFNAMIGHIVRAGKIDIEKGGLAAVKHYAMRPDLLAVTYVWQAENGGPALVAVKGAPESIAQLCAMSAEEQHKLQLRIDPMAQAGMRVLAVAEAMHEPEIHMHQRHEHMPVLLKYYEPQSKHNMWRMVLRDFKPVRGDAVRLGMNRLADIRALYAGSDGGSAFAPYQLATGYFFGVERDGRLVSIAGVHLASQKYRVGPVGNVFTLPAYRSRGYAARCTSAVAAALLADGTDTIVLNVDETNGVAIRVYERLGFEKYCEFVEGIARRKQFVSL